MTGIEIKELIDINNQKIEELLISDSFVLNKTIFDLCQTNHQLRKQCPHDFNLETNICKYCLTHYKEIE